MLDENDVVDAICEYLPSEGYQVVARKTTTQQGVDLVAVDSSGAKLLIEAKGQTSSKRTSKRYGKPFSPSQLLDHTAKALYAAAKLRCQYRNQQVALAFPDHPPIRKLVIPVKQALAKLAIDVLWVSNDGSVSWETSA